jgi:hypothetical protein
VRFVSASASTATGTWDDAPRSEAQWRRRSATRAIFYDELLAEAVCRSIARAAVNTSFNVDSVLVALAGLTSTLA